VTHDQLCLDKVSHAGRRRPMIAAVVAVAQAGIRRYPVVKVVVMVALTEIWFERHGGRRTGRISCTGEPR